MAAEFCEEYTSTLNDLTYNSKPHITTLTMLAEENRSYAQQIVQVIEAHLNKVVPELKLPVLYLIDSIVKNIGQEYVGLFTQNLVSTFCNVFEKVDEKVRMQMFKLRQTWTDFFPVKKLYAIDVRVHQIDPAWPITARTPAQPSIHVNPKFLKTNSEPDSKKDANDVQEAEMRKQLIEKQEELLRLQQEKLELELIQTKAMMEEQKRQLMLKDQQLRYQQQLQAEAHKRLLQQKLQQQLQVLQQQQQQLQQQKLHQQVIQGQPAQLFQAFQLQMMKAQQGVLPQPFPEGESLPQSSDITHKDGNCIAELSVDTIISKQVEADASSTSINVPTNSGITPTSPKVKQSLSNIVKPVSGDKEKNSKDSALHAALPVVSGKSLDAKTPKIEKTKSPIKKADKSRDAESKKRNSAAKRDKSSGRSSGGSSSKDKKSKQPDVDVGSPKSKKGKTVKDLQPSARRSRSSSKDRAASAGRKSSSPSRKVRGGSHESGSVSPTRRASKPSTAESPPTRKPKRPRASGGKSRSGKGDATPSSAKKEVAGKENSPFGGSKESLDMNPPSKKSKTEEDDKIEMLFGNTDQDYRLVHAESGIKRGSDHGGWAQYKASHPSEFKSPGVSNHPFSFGNQDMDLRPQGNQRPPPGKFRGPISFSLRRDSRDRDPRKRVRPPHVFDRMVELDSDIPKALMLDRGADILRQANQQLMDGQLTTDQHAEFMEQLGKLYELQRMRRIYQEQHLPDLFIDQPRNKIQLPFRKPNLDDDDDDNGRGDGEEIITDVGMEDDDVQIIGVVGGESNKSEATQSKDNSKASMKHDDEKSKSSRARRVKKSRFEPVTDSVTSRPNSSPSLSKIGKNVDKDVEVVGVEQGSASTVNRIMIDDRLREIRIMGDRGVVIMDGDVPREISFKGSPQEVIIDEKVILLPFDETLHIDVNGRSHTVRFGYPSREIVLDGVAYKAIFGGPPIKVAIDGRPCDVRLCGPPPEVCIGETLEGDPTLPSTCPPPIKDHDLELKMRDRGQDKDVGDRFPRDRDIVEGAPWERRGRFSSPREKERSDGPQRGSGYWDFYGEQGHRSRRFPEREFYSAPGARRGGGPPRGRRDFIDYEFRDDFGPRREPPGPGFGQGPHFDDAQVPPGPDAGSDPRNRFEGQGPHPPRHLSWRMPQPHQQMVHFHQAPGPGPPMFRPPYVYEGGPHMGPNPLPAMQMPGDPMEMGGIIGVPPLPTKPASNINELFDKLVAAGIIPKVSSGDNEGEANADRDADSEEKPREVIEKMPPMDFKMEELKVRHSSVIAHLYSGIQCSSCGVRFTSEQTEKYAQHLDWHFRQNRKEKDSVKKALSRKWFYDVQGWIQFEEVEDLEERARSFFETQANEDQAEGGGDDAPSVPANEDEKQNVCSVCGELFELYWEEDLEEWHLRDAMRAKGKNYHPICYEDLNEAVEEAKVAKQRALLADDKPEEKAEMPIDQKMESMEIDMENNAISSEPMEVDEAAVGVKTEAVLATNSDEAPESKNIEELAPNNIVAPADTTDDNPVDGNKSTDVEVPTDETGAATLNEDLSTATVTETPLDDDVETTEVTKTADNVSTDIKSAVPVVTDNAVTVKVEVSIANISAKPRSSDVFPELVANVTVTPVLGDKQLVVSSVESSANEELQPLVEEAEDDEAIKLPENKVVLEESSEVEGSVQYSSFETFGKVESMEVEESFEAEENRGEEAAVDTESASVEDAMVALFGEPCQEEVSVKEVRKEEVKVEVVEPVLDQEDEIPEEKIENILKEVHGEMLEAAQISDPLETAESEVSDKVEPPESMEVDAQEMEDANADPVDVMAYRDVPFFETQDPLASQEVESQDIDVQHAVSSDATISISFDSLSVDRKPVVSEYRVPHEQDENEVCEGKSAIVEHDETKHMPVEHDETELIGESVNKSVLTIKEGVAQISEQCIAAEAVVIKCEPEMTVKSENEQLSVEAETEQSNEVTDEGEKEVKFEVLPPVMRGTELSGLCTIL